MKTVLLVTKSAEKLPKTMAKITLKNASVIFLIENGIYSSEETLKNAGLDDMKKVKALRSDVDGRRVSTMFPLSEYGDIVDAIEKSEKVITL